MGWQIVYKYACVWDQFSPVVLDQSHDLVVWPNVWSAAADVCLTVQATTPQMRLCLKLCLLVFKWTGCKYVYKFIVCRCLRELAILTECYLRWHVHANLICLVKMGRKREKMKENGADNKTIKERRRNILKICVQVKEIIPVAVVDGWPPAVKPSLCWLL